MKQAITAIFVLITGLLFGQSYEGTLVYKVDYQFQISEKMSQLGITEEMLREKIKNDEFAADSIKTSYKGGDFISILNSKTKSWSIYKQLTNKLYTFQEGEASDVCAVIDVSIDLEFKATGNKPLLSKLDTIVEIDGRKCEIVRIQWKAGTYDYYYDSSFLKVDNKLYENYINDGWADFLAISNSLPIKIVKSVKGLTTTTLTLIRHIDETIDARLFEIPKLKADKKLNIVKLGNMELFRVKK